LRYADEVNKAQSYFREIGDAKPDPELLEMASMLIERKVGEFDPTEFHNRYVDALKKLIAEKQRKKGEKIIQEPETPLPKGSNVVDLMAALKKSLGGDEEEKPKKSAARKPAHKPAARRTAKKAEPKRAAGGRRR
jgi:DNA end-binding protein Ku